MKLRLCLRKTGEYDGIVDCIRAIYTKEGFRGFYKGLLPSILGITPYAGIDLTVFEVISNIFFLTFTLNLLNIIISI